MNGFGYMNSISDLFEAQKKEYPERTGILLAILGSLLTQLEAHHPKAYADAEKYIQWHYLNLAGKNATFPIWNSSTGE